MSGFRDRKRGDTPGPGGGKRLSAARETAVFGAPGAAGNGPPAPGRLAFASLTLRQPERGYRFGIDAVLLADFAARLGGTALLDLGTGCGVVLLLLARLLPDVRRGLGVEIQDELCRFACRNIDENGEGGRLSALRADFRERLTGVPGASFDLVVANPPYRPAGSGRKNPDPARAVARHEVACTMADLFRAAGRYLAPDGRLATLALPGRLPELLAAAAGAGIAPLALRFVHPFPGRPARLVLFAGTRRGRQPLQVQPALLVYAEAGRYSPEVEAIFRGLVPD